MVDESDQSAEAEPGRQPETADNADRQQSALEVAEAATEPEPESAEPPAEASGSLEDEDDQPIAPGSLRVDPQVGRELYGANYSGINTYGAATFGDHNKIINNIGEQRPDPIIGPLDYMPDLLAVHAATGSDAKLVELLGRRATVCLVGPKNSGRFSSACAALAHAYGKERVHEITLPAGVAADALVRKPHLVAEASGFVLRYARDDYVEAMRRLSELFRRRRSGLVLIRDQQAYGGLRHGAELDHQTPDPVAVFRRHLAQRLSMVNPRASVEAEVAGYLGNADLCEALKKTYGPKECVAMADAVAVARPGGDEEMKAVLERSQPRRRELAEAILISSVGSSGARGRRAGQHERAFRISYAVFRRQPLHYVFESTEWLLAEIDSAALRPEWGAMALQSSVDDLLGEPLSDDWEAGRDEGNASLGASRVAWMRDPGLRGAILDVAWHEFDSTRKPLLRWLDRLVNDGDVVMSRAAAETAGLLAHYDYEQVHDDLIERWASSPKRRMRQAAAWSETTAEMAGDVGDLIRERLRRWCSSGRNYQRDAAARVYASGLQQPLLAWSMRDLGLIADNPIQQRSYAVAEAVNQLYRPEAADWLITELAGWTSRAGARVHAARALVALAKRPSSDIADPRPELLAQLAAGHVAPERLAVVWRAALGDPAVVMSATGALTGWVRLADSDDDLRERVGELLALVAPRPNMRRRVAFYLRKQPEFRDGLPDWVERERSSEP
jgi:hypothetical protein